AEAASNQRRVQGEKPSVEEYFAGEGRDNGDNDSDRSVPDQVEVMEASDTTVSDRVQNVQKAADNAVLLDIVQSLPPMSSPPPELQVHNGRATRSLGSVLLEGHR